MLSFLSVVLKRKAILVLIPTVSVVSGQSLGKTRVFSIPLSSTSRPDCVFERQFLGQVSLRASRPSQKLSFSQLTLICISYFGFFALVCCLCSSLRSPKETRSSQGLTRSGRPAQICSLKRRHLMVIFILISLHFPLLEVSEKLRRKRHTNY